MVQFEVQYDDKNIPSWKVIRFSEIGPRARYGETVFTSVNKNEAYQKAEMLNRNITVASFSIPSNFVAN
jgi:hypothetical protein